MEADVNALVEPYRGADVDGMQDLKTYRRTMVNGEEVHYGTDWIFCDREYSNAFIQRRIDRLNEKFGWDVQTRLNQYGQITYDEFRTDSNQWFSSVMHQACTRCRIA